jgi:hypothetical protein
MEKKSPLEVKGIDLNINSEEMVDIVRETRSGRYSKLD